MSGMAVPLTACPPPPPVYWRKSIVFLYSTRTDMRIESTYIWQGDRATVTGDQ